MSQYDVMSIAYTDCVIIRVVPVVQFAVCSISFGPIESSG